MTSLDTFGVEMCEIVTVVYAIICRILPTGANFHFQSLMKTRSLLQLDSCSDGKDSLHTVLCFMSKILFSAPHTHNSEAEHCKILLTSDLTGVHITFEPKNKGGERQRTLAFWVFPCWAYILEGVIK